MFPATVLAVAVTVSLASGVELELEKDRIQAEENRRMDEIRRSEERSRRDAEQRQQEERMHERQRREELERQRTAEPDKRPVRTEPAHPSDRARPDTSRLQRNEKLGMWVPRSEETNAQREIQERQRRLQEGTPVDPARSKGSASSKSARPPASSGGLDGEVMSVEEAVGVAPPPAKTGGKRP